MAGRESGSLQGWGGSSGNREEKLESGGSLVGVRGETRRPGRGYEKRGCFADLVW